MLITISPEQIDRLRALVEPVNVAHFDDGCEPPGYSIEISFGGPYGNSAVARCGNQTVDLGEVAVLPAQDAWTATSDAGATAEELFSLGARHDDPAAGDAGLAQALRYYRLAAARGSAMAQFNLGVMYDEGRGVAQDATQAARWYYCAALQGHAAAQNNFGATVEHGEASDGHLARAADWYRLAAEQGNAEAQCNLAAMYLHGRGVEQDHAKALALYGASAQQGNVEAQRWLDAIDAAMTDTQQKDRT